MQFPFRHLPPLRAFDGTEWACHAGWGFSKRFTRRSRAADPLHQPRTGGIISRELNAERFVAFSGLTLAAVSPSRRGRVGCRRGPHTFW
jgi:hypothetical protein